MKEEKAKKSVDPFSAKKLTAERMERRGRNHSSPSPSLPSCRPLPILSASAVSFVGEKDVGRGREEEQVAAEAVAAMARRGRIPILFPSPPPSWNPRNLQQK